MGRLMRWVARMRARGHQKLSIFLMVASPWRQQMPVSLRVNGAKWNLKKKKNKKTYPHVQAAGVWDVVVDVTVITQADDGETHQGAHVQGQDGDEQRLDALQVAVEEDGHEDDLRERRTR